MAEERKPELRIVGGHPVLDLVNTVTPRRPGGREHLTSPTALLAWSRRVGLVGAGEARAVGAAWRARPGSAGQALHAALDVRESVYEVLAARLLDATPAPGAEPPALAGARDGRRGHTSSLRSSAADRAGPGARPAAALEHLALRWAAATARSTLVAAADRPAEVVVGTDLAFAVPDRLAFAAVELLRAVDPAHVKQCPAGEGGCGWLFLDQSRNGSRRWCAMADCGAQAKARKLTARRRAARASTVEA
ncbi:CGNR zinc finger domain-containing protein [Phytohabitans suffuscus]|uniref:CGNR zinc finger domain-containing protein n=1 Tax=Phytohabitans suffuscus TaxID=624315 RepID=UPI0018D62119|nr:CGNR zinc finger domain-containing protein [Phytohabitans suffuscus]